jgi:hypothetical protein
MSSISSQVLADLASASKEPECEPSRSARLIPSANACLPGTGQKYHATPTSKPLTENLVTLSRPASHVRTPALDKPNGENASELTGNGLDYGERSNDWPLNYDHQSSCWRTCQGSLVQDLDVFSGTWPRSGYDAEWRCIPASKASLPHRRDRLWIVAYPSGSRLSRHIGRASILESAEATLAELGDAAAGAWRALDRDLLGLRASDGHTAVELKPSAIRLSRKSQKQSDAQS